MSVYMLVFYGEKRIVLTKPIIIRYVDIVILDWIPVYNNSCSICISCELNTMGPIINLLHCNTPIDNIDYHTLDFYVFVCWYWSIAEEVWNITALPTFS